MKCSCQAAWRSFLWAFDHSKARCGLPEGATLRNARALHRVSVLRTKSVLRICGLQIACAIFQTFEPGQPSPPIWPCTTRGLPCRQLLPARWALTPPFHPYLCGGLNWPAERFCLQPITEAHSHRRFIFCGTVRSRSRLCFSPLALPGALPCGVRTFLQPVQFAMVCDERTSDHPTRPLAIIISGICAARKRKGMPAVI